MQEIIDFFEQYQGAFTLNNQDYQQHELANMRIYANALANPQKKFKVIHVAGSKGKGSSSFAIAKGLEAAGKNVALFTSPYVFRFEEMFLVNGSFVESRVLEEVFQVFKNFVLEELPLIPELAPRPPRYFELLVLFAWLVFAKLSCEYLVLETGLGGRVDATNIVEPILSVVTRIELEHQDLLGASIVDIAREKAGIIKDKTPVFCAQQEEQALEVLKSEARRRNAAFFYIPIPNSGTEPKFTANSYRQNTSLAAAVNKYLLSSSSRTPSALASLPGRLQVVELELACGTKQLLLLDIAHTLESINLVMSFIKELSSAELDISVLFSSLASKNYAQYAELITSNCQNIILTELANPRKAKLASLEQAFSKYTGLRTSPNPEEGLYKALELVSDLASECWKDKLESKKFTIKAAQLKNAKQAQSKLLLITGSVYLLRELGSILGL